MSETLTYIEETNIQSVVAEAETIAEQFPRLDGELMPLVVANADMVAPCPWMGGAEVSISSAMLNYYRPMTEDIAGEIIAEVYSMLENRIEEKVEPEEEKQAQENEPEKDISEEPDQAPTKTVSKADKKTKIETKTQKADPKLSRNTEKLAQAENGVKLPPTAIEATAQDIVVTKTTVESQAAKSTPNVAFVGIEVEAQTEPNNIQPVPAGEVELFASAKTGLDEDTEFPAAPITEYREVDFLDDATEQTNKIQLAAEALDYTNLDNEIQMKYSTNPDGMESPISYLQTEVALLSEQPETPLSMSILEQFNKLNQPIREAESALAHVAEKLDVSPEATVEAANEILDKIMQLPGKIEGQNLTEASEAEATEELEDLFIELFELLGIDYTSGLIESLARLTIQTYFGQEGPTSRKAEDDELSMDYGTHETITDLLRSLGDTKKAMAQVYAIGKTALCQYVYDFPAELRKRLAA